MKCRPAKLISKKAMMLGDSHRIKLLPVVGALLAGSARVLAPPPIFVKPPISQGSFGNSHVFSYCLRARVLRRGLFVLQWDFLTACQPCFVSCARELGLTDGIGQVLSA